MSETDRIRFKEQQLQEYEAIAKDVELWAEQILFPKSVANATINNNHNHDQTVQQQQLQQDNDVDTTWTEIPCHKMFQQKFNRNGSTRAYVKWMKDSRVSSSSESSLLSESLQNGTPIQESYL